MESRFLRALYIYSSSLDFFGLPPALNVQQKIKNFSPDFMQEFPPRGACYVGIRHQIATAENKIFQRGISTKISLSFCLFRCFWLCWFKVIYQAVIVFDIAPRVLYLPFG